MRWSSLALLVLLAYDPSPPVATSGPWYLVRTMGRTKTYEGPYLAWADCKMILDEEKRTDPGADIECSDGSDLDL